MEEEDVFDPLVPSSDRFASEIAAHPVNKCWPVMRRLAGLGVDVWDLHFSVDSTRIENALEGIQDVWDSPETLNILVEVHSTQLLPKVMPKSGIIPSELAEYASAWRLIIYNLGVLLRASDLYKKHGHVKEFVNAVAPGTVSRFLDEI